MELGGGLVNKINLGGGLVNCRKINPESMGILQWAVALMIEAESASVVKIPASCHHEVDMTNN